MQRTALLACLPILMAGCERSEDASSAPRPEDRPGQLLESVNGLAGLESEVYEHFSQSPIHWQPLGAEVFERSKASERLIFCVLARPQDPGFYGMMEELEGDSEVVAEINQHYLPVLVDLDQAREFQLFARMISLEIRQPLSFPVLLWLDYHARPYETIRRPMRKGLVVANFRYTHQSVILQWRKDLEDHPGNPAAGQVISNNRIDHRYRHIRLMSQHAGERFTEDELAATSAAVEQLVNAYDGYSYQFQRTGPLLPSRIIALLARAAACERLDSNLREKCLEVLESIVPKLLQSPMVDPLDGGVFSYRQGRSWQLPAFSKNSVYQIEFARALLLCEKVGVPGAGDAALQLIASIEKNGFGTDGLPALAATVDTALQKWTWSTEEVREILGSEDAQWWIEMTGMEELGNLTGEKVKLNGMFRRNALAMRKSTEEMAKSTGLTQEAFAQRLEQARTKLLKARTERFERSSPRSSPHLEAGFAMVSLHALAHQWSGDPQWRDKAIALHRKCREHFVRDGQLMAGHEPARAYHHAKALQACCDLLSIAPEAVDAGAITAMHLRHLDGVHLRNGLLNECDPDHNIVDLPLENDRIAFGSCTVGILKGVEIQLAEFGIEMPGELKQHVRRLPLAAEVLPVIYTDHLEAVLEGYSSKNR